MFFIDFDTIFDALNEKCEIFDAMIVSKIIVDSNICFDVAIKISNSCDIDEINESSKINFSLFLHINLSVLIEKDELLMSFFACCSRTCSRNFSLKLKFELQRMQMIFEQLTFDFANATTTKSMRKISIHSHNDVKFMMFCLSYQISKTKSYKFDNNKKSKFDSLYWCSLC